MFRIGGFGMLKEGKHIFLSLLLRPISNSPPAYFNGGINDSGFVALVKRLD